MLYCDFDEFFQFFSVVHNSNLLAKKFVQDQTDDIAQGKGENHDKPRDKYCLGTDCQAMSGAKRLWDNFPKNHNSHCGESHGKNTRGEIIQEDG